MGDQDSVLLLQQLRWRLADLQRVRAGMERAKSAFGPAGGRHYAEFVRATRAVDDAVEHLLAAFPARGASPPP